MKILIVYATSEGQTLKISRYMEEVLQEENHQVVIADSTDDPPSPAGYDAVLIGASIHMHRYQNSIRSYILENVKSLNQTHSAFFSVCLAVASEIEEEHEEAQEIAEDFLEFTGWVPDETVHIAGALKFTKYDYFKRLIMRMIAKKEGRDTDTSQDYEYTDWPAVKKFVLNFAD